MKDRIRELRKALKLSQTEFGERCGTSRSAVQKWESGENTMSDMVVLLVHREFNVSEEWLRTGEGEMFVRESAAAEMGRLVGEMMGDRPESFRTALISAMLRIPPESPVWDALEKAVTEIAQQYKGETPED